MKGCSDFRFRTKGEPDIQEDEYGYDFACENCYKGIPLVVKKGVSLRSLFRKTKVVCPFCGCGSVTEVFFPFCGPRILFPPPYVSEAEILKGRNNGKE